MRSIGPVLVLLGLATTVVLVLVLFQALGARNDLEGIRAELGTLRAEAEAQPPAVTEAELEQRLGDLEATINEALSGGGPNATPIGGGSTADEEILDRVDEVLARIEALEDRLDEICERVPVC